MEKVRTWPWETSDVCCLENILAIPSSYWAVGRIIRGRPVSSSRPGICRFVNACVIHNFIPVLYCDHNPSSEGHKQGPFLPWESQAVAVATTLSRFLGLSRCTNYQGIFLPGIINSGSERFTAQRRAWLSWEKLTFTIKGLLCLFLDACESLNIIFIVWITKYCFPKCLKDISKSCKPSTSVVCPPGAWSLEGQ